MSVMEIALKVGVSLVVVVLMWYQLVFLKWTWSNQIDPRATFSRFLKKAAPDGNLLATRDPQKIYQAGNVVGEVTGEVVIQDQCVIFKELCNTCALDQNAPFEHKRGKYRIVRIGAIMGQKIQMSDGKTETKKDILKDLVCERIE